jgi:hypothetical protein
MGEVTQLHPAAAQPSIDERLAFAREQLVGYFRTADDLDEDTEAFLVAAWMLASTRRQTASTQERREMWQQASDALASVLSFNSPAEQAASRAAEQAEIEAERRRDAIRGRVELHW